MARRDLTGAVDFAYLESYTAGDSDLIDEVLSMFREQTGLWMKLLDPMAPGGAWRDAAHTLKGAALGIGANELAQTCQAAEAAIEAPMHEKQLLLDRVRNACDRALADIAAYAHERALQSLKTPR
jgi:HPt (histidine-containing phosphotransfer) domain-containing protein